MALMHPESHLPQQRRAQRVAAALSMCIACSPAVACWDDVASWYGVNVHLLYAIAKTESSFNPNAMNRNKNGTYDVGLMQINSTWLPTLRKYGVTEAHLKDPCTNLQVGAWILSHNMARMGTTWEAVGAYNARNPQLRIKYAQKVYKNIPREHLMPDSD